MAEATKPKMGLVLRAKHYSHMHRDFGDDAYDFALPYAQIVELETKRDSGPLVILERLQGGSWHVNDVRETIRLALIGGGTAPVHALAIVRDYIDQRPTAEALPLAAEILSTAIFGPPPPEPEPPAGDDTKPEGTSEPSGEPEASS